MKRKKKALPVVAVVGYANAGKTTLIKQLTKEESMEPKDQLFATLDSTVHAGKLPCKMKVLFLDTIGYQIFHMNWLNHFLLHWKMCCWR